MQKLREDLVKGIFMKKKKGDIVTGFLNLRANSPARMSLRILICQEKDIFSGVFAVKVSEPARMSPAPFLVTFWPIRGLNQGTLVIHITPKLKF